MVKDLSGVIVTAIEAAVNDSLKTAAQRREASRYEQRGKDNMKGSLDRLNPTWRYDSSKRSII
jgi:hypothetical protein